MPELPEVETIVRDLRPVLVGQAFVGIEADYMPVILPDSDSFKILKGNKVSSIERRGKFINIFFDSNLVVTIHLRMSGRLLISDLETTKLPYERTRLNFSSNSLRFCDMRKFGRVWLSDIGTYEKFTGIYKLGIEPFSDEFDLKYFEGLLDGRKGIVKRWLLDQSVVAGIGNIYADEACFYAGIKPHSKLENLRKKDVEALYYSIIRALEQGIRNRGTSISDFNDAYGRNGKNQELLYVYGRGGQSCFKCKSALIKTVVASRGTVYCENCQK